MDHNAILDCNKCSINNRTCAILEIKNTFWNTYALVLYEDDGSLEKVSLDRLCDVKLKEAKEWTKILLFAQIESVISLNVKGI